MPSGCCDGGGAAFATVGANAVAAAEAGRGAGVAGPMASRQTPHRPKAVASPRAAKKTDDLRGTAFIEGVLGGGATERLLEMSQERAPP